MKKTVMPLLALTIIATAFSCNTETSQVASATDSTSKQADNAVAFEADQSTDAKATETTTEPKTITKVEQKTETTVSEPATPKADDITFNKVLSYKNISFKVTAKGKGSLQKLTIQPSGLSADNKTVTLETDPVVSARAADLNADGYPELLVFTRSAGSGSYGKVVAYSVNNGKSMSRVTFPATGDNASINKGYMGHDRFSVVKNQLTQTFPVYKKNDANTDATKKERVVTYKLTNGEASRVFVVSQVKETTHK